MCVEVDVSTTSLSFDVATKRGMIRPMTMLIIGHHFHSIKFMGHYTFRIVGRIICHRSTMVMVIMMMLNNVLLYITMIMSIMRMHIEVLLYITMMIMAMNFDALYISMVIQMHIDVLYIITVVIIGIHIGVLYITTMSNFTTMMIEKDMVKLATVVGHDVAQLATIFGHDMASLTTKVGAILITMMVGHDIVNFNTMRMIGHDEAKFTTMVGLNVVNVIVMLSHNVTRMIGQDVVRITTRVMIGHNVANLIMMMLPRGAANFTTMMTVEHDMAKFESATMVEHSMPSFTTMMIFGHDVVNVPPIVMMIGHDDVATATVSRHDVANLGAMKVGDNVGNAPAALPLDVHTASLRHVQCARLMATHL